MKTFHVRLSADELYLLCAALALAASYLDEAAVEEDGVSEVGRQADEMEVLLNRLNEMREGVEG